MTKEMHMANFVNKRACSSLVALWLLAASIASSGLIAEPVNADDYPPNLIRLLLPAPELLGHWRIIRCALR